MVGMMAYPNDPLVNPLDYEAQQYAMEQQLAQIQALRKMQYQTPEAPGEVGGWQSAVTGSRVPGRQLYMNPLSAIAPLVAGATADRQSVELGKQRQQSIDQQVQRAATWGSKIPQGGPGPGPMGPEPYVEPTQQEMMAHAATGLQMPLTRPLALKLMENYMTDVPKQERQLLSQRIEHIRQQINADRTAAELHRHNVSTEGRPISGGESGLWVQDGQGNWKLIAGPGGPGKSLPPGPSKSWMENNVTLGKITDLEAMLKTGPGKDAVGWQRGLAAIFPFGDKINNWFDPNGAATRAMVQSIGAIRVHDLTGAVVPIAEYSRLAAHIPEVGDSAPIVAIKLGNLKREYQLMQEEIRQYAEEQGYKIPGASRPSQPVAPPEIPAPAPAASAPAEPRRFNRDTGRIGP